MIKKTLKGIGYFLLVSLILAAGWIGLNRKALKNLADLNSSWYAQMTCSCVFVTQRSEADCRKYAREFLPYKSMRIDRAKKTVTVTATAIALWNTNTSKYEGPRYGCRLQKK